MLPASCRLHNSLHVEECKQVVQASNANKQSEQASQRSTQAVTDTLKQKEVTLFINTPEQTMNADQMLTEIREANLSYLMLAQSLIRTDRDQALYRLGVSEDTAIMISLMTPAQVMKIASGNTLLCRFRMDDDLVWGLLTNHGKGAANDTTTRLHASILMAGRHQEAA